MLDVLDRSHAYSHSLASLKFDKIGSLREDSDGGFSVVAFADSATGSSKARASAYNKLAKSKQGPFSSIPEFYDAMSDLNDLNVNEDPESEDEEEEETDRENRVLQNKQLREMAPHFIIDAFCNGPFVIHHDDLTTGNILVSKPSTKIKLKRTDIIRSMSISILREF